MFDSVQTRASLSPERALTARQFAASFRVGNSPSLNFSEDAGPDGLRIGSTSAGPATHAPSAVQAETPCSSARLALRSPLHQGRLQLHRSPGPLEGPRLVPDRCSLKEEGDHDRCLQLGLGSSVQGQAGLWLLVEHGAAASYQLLRDNGGFSFSQNLPTRPDRAPCFSPIGHHVLLEPPGWCQVKASA